MTYLFSGNSTITNEVEVKNDVGNALPVWGNVYLNNNTSRVTTSNPLPVSLGGANITIIGNTNIVDTVTVNSSPEDPVHNHITEIGTSGNLIALGYSSMPVQGNVYITNNQSSVSITNPLPVTGNIIVTPSLESGDFYGEPYAITITPLVQLNGHDGILLNDMQSYTASGGATTVVDGVYNVACSTTSGSYGVLRSRRFSVHRAGQSSVARFLAKFDTPAATTQQLIGLQNQESAIYIGYNGTQFGIQKSYGGRAAIYSLKINSYTGNQTVTLTLNSTVYSISIATGETVNKAAQRIAAAMTDGTWLANQVDDTVYFLSSTVGDKVGTFSVSSSGNLSSTLTRQVQGVAATTTWFYNGTDFNLPAAIDITHYNEWQIKYDWVGATYSVLNISTNRFEIFYRQLHNTVLEIKSASFKIAAVCYNTGGSNAVTLQVPSMMAGLEGEEVFNGFPHSTSNTQTSLAANKYWNLLTLQNPYVFNNKINTRQSRLLNLTVAAESGDPVQILLVMDPVLSTAIYNFTSQNGFMVSYDNTTEAEVVMSNNYPVLTLACPKTGGQIYELRDYRMVIPPGVKISVVAYGTASISRITTAINWVDK